MGELHADAESPKYGNNDNFPHCYQNGISSSAIAEVLDLTHDSADPFKLHFDDTKWYKHLNSLKPLGLAILLNTCNETTQVSFLFFFLVSLNYYTKSNLYFIRSITWSFVHISLVKQCTMKV